MMTRTDDKQIKFYLITLESFVPADHFLRKLDRLVDFSFIYYGEGGCGRKHHFNRLYPYKSQCFPKKEHPGDGAGENKPIYGGRLDFYEGQERQWLEQSGAIPPKRKSRAPKEKRPTEKTISPADPEVGKANRTALPEPP